MFSVEGIEFSSKREYELALEDKAIIDDIKRKVDLNTKDGVLKAYSLLQSVHFNTKVGFKFDDHIFELHEEIKKGTFAPTGTEVSVNTKSKTVKAKNSKTVKTPRPEIKLDAETKKKVAKEIKRQNLMRDMLILLLLVIGFFSIGYFVKYYVSAEKVQKDAEEIAELKDEKYADILKNVQPVVTKNYEEEVVIPDILDEYLALYNKNKSLIGWIKIADTIIDYPVMQTTDNEYYLKHNFNQQNDSNGCIFMDYNCDVILGNDNWILYGHHMKSGKMFAILQSYAKQDYYEKHKIVQFDTIYEKGTYEVMYAFRSHIYNSDEVAFKYYQFIDASSKEEFDSNMEEMEALNLINTGVTAQYGDRLLTLSTCDYQEANGRFVVVCKKID